MNENTTDKKIDIIEKTGCKAELLEIVSSVEDDEILHDFHTYATQRISGRTVEYHVSDPDYGDMIIEMVGKIEDERLLKYFYVFMSEKLKRAP